jgi:hypothetical protein
MSPDMFPGTLLSILAPSPPPLTKQKNFSEPPKNGTTSGAPLRRVDEITQAPGLRNIKTASGKVSPRCFRRLLHKRHANPTRELDFGAEQADRLSKIAIWNLLLAARAALGHIRPNGAVAEWLKAAVC